MPQTNRKIAAILGGALAAAVLQALLCGSAAIGILGLAATEGLSGAWWAAGAGGVLGVIGPAGFLFRSDLARRYLVVQFALLSAAVFVWTMSRLIERGMGAEGLWPLKRLGAAASLMGLACGYLARDVREWCLKRGSLAPPVA